MTPRADRNADGNTLRGLAALLFLVFLAAAPPLSADPTYYVQRGSSWKYLQGTQEASSPDASAWRALGFAETGWGTGAAPFGYGDGPYGTNLSQLAPPMRNNYSTLFLRKAFQVADPARVAELEVNANYDDGLVAWVNGVEVLRVNVPGAPGDPVAYDGFSSGDHEQGPFEVFDLPDPGTYLASGTNVLAVQVFNTSITSSDLTLELELYDPLGPDVRPPAVAALAPPAGAVVSALASVEVTFDEPVSGVDAADLRANGSAASSLSGSGAGPYVFGFAEPPPGAVLFTWTPGHGIEDLAAPPNAFGGGSWTVTLDPGAPTVDLAITEILASSAGGLLDEDGEASDWIEVQNRGAAAVSLAGVGLTDDPDEPAKWTFPAVTLGAGQYRIVFASGKDRRPTGAGNLHASFKLNAAGEYLGLFSAESPRRALSEHAPRFPEQRTGFSYGLDATGALGYFDAPTPGAPNGGSGAYAGFTAEPKPSVSRGIHDAALSVELSSTTPGAQIRYTLDGREPTETSGTLYAGPIAVQGTAQKGAVTVRALARASGYLPSNVVTHTYIFPAQVVAQPKAPAGFPATWGSGATTAADYEMDPRVVNDAAHAALVREGIVSVPSLSIVMDPGDLFGTSRGIYSNPSLEGIAWERPASAEMVFPDAREPFQIDCGVRIQGGSSTSNWKSLKLSMRILFRDDYGASKLRYPLFAGSRVDSFDTLVLDAGLNLTWNHPDHGQRVRSQYIRDQYTSDLQLATGSEGPRGILVHLYLNGLYWGVYVVHERPDDSFSAEYFGGEKEDYDAIRHVGTEVVAGDLEAWNAMMGIARAGLTTNAQYEALQAYLDARNLADYMLVNLFVGNDDWPRHNWYASRRRAPGGAFRFFSWDAEHVLKDVNINQTGVSLANSPAELYSRLRANAEFRLLFADRAHRLFFGGGPLAVDPGSPAWDPARPERNRPAALYVRRVDEIDPAIACESARWGDVRRPAQPYTRNAEWQAELDWLLAQYFPRRSAIVLDQLRAASLYPSVGAPVLSRHGGTIEPGFALALSRPPGTGGTIYYSIDGSDPRTYGSGGVAPAARIYSSPIVLEDRTHLRARILDGATWSALAEALFTLDAPLSAVRITEIMYNPLGGRPYEFLELWSSAETTLELGGAYFSSGIDLVFPPATAIAPGEHLVLAADPAAFAERYPAAPVAGGYAGSLDNSGERVTLRGPDGVAIVSVDYDDSGSWPVGPDGFGYSLVSVDPLADPDDPASWRASSGLGGSPGAEDPPDAPGGVVINEVLPRAPEDAIELHNPTASPIAIGGWYLSDRRDDEASLRKFRIPAGTVVAAGGYAVFFESQFNPAPGSPTSFELAAGGGRVYLASAGPAGNLSGYITGFELGGAEEGVSFGRHPTTEGVDFTAMLSTTLGGPNSGPRVGPVVLNELRYHPPPGEAEFIELHNLASSPVALHDGATGRGWRIDGVLDAAGTDDFELEPGTRIPAKGFLLVVGTDPAEFRARYAVPASVPIAGPFGGALDNAGERISLYRPDRADGETIFVLADRVRYDNGAPWPAAPDGGAPSLERERAQEYGNDPVNWDASTVSGGTPGRQNSVSGPGGENVPPVAVFTASPERGFAPLDVGFEAKGSFDPDGSITGFEWSFGDGATGEGEEATHLYGSPGSYRVTLVVVDERGARGEASRTVLIEERPPPPDPMSVPGDVNRDAKLDISDAVALLGHLFLGSPSELPCGDGTLFDPANLALLSSNGDADVDLSDAVYVLLYLFAGGPPPARGAGCVAFPGCPDTCGG